MMLRKIAQLVLIPEALAVCKREFAHAMSARMQKDSLRAVGNAPAPVTEATAKIDVFKPDREKLLIETCQVAPCAALKCEAGAGRLFDFLCAIVIYIQAAIMTVPRIARPKSVHEQELAEGSRQSREPADREAPLGRTAVQKFTARRSGTVRSKRVCQVLEGIGIRNYVGIENDANLAFRGSDALVHRRGKASVFRVRQN